MKIKKNGVTINLTEAEIKKLSKIILKEGMNEPQAIDLLNDQISKLEDIVGNIESGPQGYDTGQTDTYSPLRFWGNESSEWSEEMGNKVATVITELEKLKDEFHTMLGGRY